MTTDTHQHEALTVAEIAELRSRFPILRIEPHGKPLVYLDNAATTQKPDSVIDAMRSYYETANANVHRGVHFLSQEATEAYENARRAVQRFIGAADPREIIFLRGTTEAVNLVAQACARPMLGPGDEVLITYLEHHSNIVPWQIVCEQTGATLRVAQVLDDGELDLESFKGLLSERTKIAAFTHVSNAFGTVNPVVEMVREAKAVGAITLIDGAQAGAHERIDVAEIDCDFYAISGHKMFAPTGIGALYGRLELLASMPPYQGGGEMIQSVSFERTLYAEPPARFEAGTPNIAGAIGLGAAIEFIESIGLGRIARHEHALLEAAEAELEGIAGLRLYGVARPKAAVVSFTVKGIHPHDLGTVLDYEGVAVRTGHHCAEPLMRRFGLSGTARASFAMYNTVEEAALLGEALRKAVEMFS